MATRPDFNFEEAIHGILETRTALERALTSMSRLERLLSERPAAFGPLAEPAFRLRDRLIEDLGTLDARLAQAASDPREGGEAGERAADRPEVPLGDAVALGGQ